MTNTKSSCESDDEEALLFNEYYEKYNELMVKNLRFLTPGGNISYFAHQKVSILKRILPFPPQSLLEYGCGIGNNLFFLQKVFPHTDIWGCDTSEKSLAAARRHFSNIHFFSVLADDEHRQFDCVLVGDVIHHIPSSQRPYYMKKIADYVRPGGCCVFFEHNPINPITQLLVNTCPFDAHAELIRPHRLKALASDNNLQIIDSRYCFFFPEFLKSLDKYEKKLSKIPLGGKYYVLTSKNP